jgi:hypothetical protein
MAVNLSALAGAGQQFFDNSGVILSGGKLYSYAAGTTTPQTTYTSASGNTAHTNPIVLNSAGRVATGEIWLTAGTNYKFVLYTSTDVLIASWDNITGINGTGITSNASNVQYDPAGTGAVATTVQAKLRESVSVLDFGADSTGTNDCTTAIQNATNTGKPVYFPAGTYKMLSSVTYTGTVVWYGEGSESIINSDVDVITVTSGPNSAIDNLYLQNITAPWIISRNPANWSAVPSVVQSNGLGYQPTVNDVDVWSGLTTAQQNQDVGPKIVFQGDASRISISRIYGRFVSISLYDTQYTTVRDCNFQAGKGLFGGISFWNINSQQGEYNQAINNTITYASFNGIVFARNFDGLAEGNVLLNVGESGIKTYQGTLVSGTVDARCYRMQLLNNNSMYAYYDGFDFSSDFPHTGTIDSRHLIMGNITYGNRQTGFFADGLNTQFIGNQARFCGLSGFGLSYGQSLISNNLAWGCNQSAAVSGTHQMYVNGDGNTISTNYLNQAGAVYGYALFATGTNLVTNNYGYGGTIFLGNAYAVTAQTMGNIDSTVSIQGTFTPTFVVGTTAQTTSLALGSYTKIGRRVVFDITIQHSGSVTGTGNINIGFGAAPAVGSNGAYGSVCGVIAQNASYTGVLSGLINDAATKIDLIINTNGTLTNITEANVAATTKYFISGSYITAQ